MGNRAGASGVRRERCRYSRGCETHGNNVVDQVRETPAREHLGSEDLLHAGLNLSSWQEKRVLTNHYSGSPSP